MVNQDLGRVSVILRGEYDPEASYERLDCVSYHGSSYLVRKACQGIAPETGEYYQLAALAGSSAAADAAAEVANAAAENADAAAGRADTAAGNAQAVADAVSGDVNQIKDDLANKIDKPSTAPAVDKILKVTAVNDDGTFVCEWADAPSGGCDEIFVDNNLLFSETLQENVSMLNTGITYGELKSYKTLIISMVQDAVCWRGAEFLDGSKITAYFRTYSKNAAFLLRRIGDGVYMLYASSLKIVDPFTSTASETFKLHTIVKFTENDDSQLCLYFSAGDTTGLNVKVYGVTI